MYWCDFYYNDERRVCVCAIFLLLCRLFLSPFDFLELDVPVERQYITPLCVFSFEN